MFVTLPQNQITQLVRTLDTGETDAIPDLTHWWRLVEVSAELPWWFVVLCLDDGEEHGGILISDPVIFHDYVANAGQSIRSITFALPPTMSGSPDWRFETLTGCWKGRLQSIDQPAWIYDTEVGQSHVVAPQIPRKCSVERVSQFYSAT